jgi:hypothetical protein
MVLIKVKHINAQVNLGLQGGFIFTNLGDPDSERSHQGHCKKTQSSKLFWVREVIDGVRSGVSHIFFDGMHRFGAAHEVGYIEVTQHKKHSALLHSVIVEKSKGPKHE